MAGYQTAFAGNLILQRGRPPTPVVNIELVRPAAARTPAGLKARKHKNEPLSQALINGIRADRGLGHSASVIGKKFGVTHTSVLAHTKDILPPEGGWLKGARKTRFNVAKAQRMQRAGFSYAEIAEDFGCVRGAIWNLLNKRTGKSALGGDGRTHRLISAVAAGTGVSRTVLCRKKDDEAGRVPFEVSRARHVVFWLMIKRRKLTLQKTSSALRGFDQSSIRHGVRRVDEVLEAHGINPDLPMPKFVAAVWAVEWPTRKAA